MKRNYPTAEERATRELQIVALSKQGVQPNDISTKLQINRSTVYNTLNRYAQKNPQERAHITMRINKMGKKDVSRDGDKITKNVTSQKVLTYGVHSIVLDDRHPRKIYLQANGNIHVE